MPKFLSPSQVTTWEECSYQWFLLHVEHKVAAPNYHFIHGDAIHQMLQAAGQDYIEGAPEPTDPQLYAEILFEIYRLAFETRRGRDDPRELLTREQLRRGEEDARAIIRAFLEEIRPSYRPISTEETLGEQVGLAIPEARDWFVRGRIDARVRLKQGYAALDWKTGAPWEPNAERGKPQGLAYPLMELWRWQVEAGEPDAVPPATITLFVVLPVVDGVCTPQRRGVTHSLASLNAYGEHLRHVADAIDDARTQGVYTPNVGSRCARCGVLAHCAYGADYVRKKRLPVLTPGVKL